MIKKPHSKPLRLGSSGIMDVLRAVLKGNARGNVNKGRFTIFPKNSSEARNPQKVKRYD